MGDFSKSLDFHRNGQVTNSFPEQVFLKAVEASLLKPQCIKKQGKVEEGGAGCYFQQFAAWDFSSV